MSKTDPAAFFTEDHAAQYDKRFEKTAPLRDALHLLICAVFDPLPADARILCVGAGTGAEILKLASMFPGWHFAAVEPSAPMLALCRRKAEAAGIAERCEFHEGYLNTLPATEPFHAATSLLVSHFIVDRAARVQYYRAIAERLLPNGLLVSADLAGDLPSQGYQEDLEIWMALMRQADVPAENVENLRVVYGREVAMIPPEEVRSIIADAGFEPPAPFLQTGLIHACRSRRAR
ncbi:tRNA (cmo5U34)-methyltransferase [Prosthecobacter debontii]|uniref:tRNA (Cmo5U34)-methyltransferase n=1 Tax=Prosthecobacter debontii TaxID=48467 RepID=A0A1T4YN53_9BACT|nr:class I SAM-dependent methyltransferase [Prosthecobacter debontii]SKB02988.1 tRNA (cmo5U34)-methyltransferase [Prosthecobacter debontii]